MDTQEHGERARAVLVRLRDQLVEAKQRRPNPHTLVPADLAELFNDTVADLEEEYGAVWVAAMSISRWTLIPASARAGGDPAVASISRETLLSHVRTALRRVDMDARVHQDRPSVTPSHPIATTVMTPRAPALNESSA